MSTICQNCNKNFEGNFCNNCGQSAKTHKMNFHFLWHDLQHGLLHVDKGIFFTAKELFTRPGHSIREYIHGKRVNHFKPISLVIIFAGLYGFLFHYFEINILSNNISVSGSGEDYIKMKTTVEKMTNWASQHYAVIALATLPIFSLGTYLGFKKAGYNFVEHFILNAFLTGQRLILHIILFPLYYAVNGSSYLKQIGRFVDILGGLLMIWALFQFFYTQEKWKTLLQILFSYLIIVCIMLAFFTAIFSIALAYYS